MEKQWGLVLIGMDFALLGIGGHQTMLSMLHLRCALHFFFDLIFFNIHKLIIFHKIYDVYILFVGTGDCFKGWGKWRRLDNQASVKNLWV